MLKLIFLAVLVGASANVVRREVACEKQLLPFVDDPNPICAKIYETREAVKNGIADVENTINDSSKESVEDFSGIVESTVRYLKERLPSYLPVRISREVAEDVAEEDFSEFNKLVAAAAEAAVAADVAASKKILHSILEAVGQLHQDEDRINQGAQKILKNIVQKRAAQDDLKAALATIDSELKAELSKALQVCLDEFRVIVKYMLDKLKALLAGKVEVAYDKNMEEINKLYVEALDRIIEQYDSSARPQLENAIQKIHDLLVASRKIVAEKPEAYDAIAQVISGLSAETAKERSTFADVREAFIKAARAMVDDFKDIAALVRKM